MNTLTTEQIREILESAPDGATHYNPYNYEWYRSTEPHGELWYYNLSREWYRLREGEPNDVTNSLSDLREILELRERVAELEALLVDSAKAADLHYQQRNHAVGAREAAERERDELAGFVKQFLDTQEKNYGDGMGTHIEMKKLANKIRSGKDGE